MVSFKKKNYIELFLIIMEYFFKMIVFFKLAHGDFQKISREMPWKQGTTPRLLTVPPLFYWLVPMKAGA